MESDPDFCDAKVAGWWVWGINSWIGGGWCSGDGPHTIESVSEDQRPHLGDAGQGVSRRLPHLGNAGQGVNRQLPHLGDGDHGGQLRPNPQLEDYFQSLYTRLRRVRVCCGDWSRVVTNGALAFGDSVGVFLDPPYDESIRRACYNTDGQGNGNRSSEVRDWAIANGDNPRYRIVLAGYDGEHKMPDSWRVHQWKAGRCYGKSTNAESANSKNRHKERLWFSPNCIKPEQAIFQL